MSPTHSHRHRRSTLIASYLRFTSRMASTIWASSSGRWRVRAFRIEITAMDSNLAKPKSILLFLLVACLLIVYLICYFSLWKGISTSGKVSWIKSSGSVSSNSQRLSFSGRLVHSFVPICGSIGLIDSRVSFVTAKVWNIYEPQAFLRITLPGSAEGIKYYLKPDFDAIYKPAVWVDGESKAVLKLRRYDNFNYSHSRNASLFLTRAGFRSASCLCFLQQIPQQRLQVSRMHADYQRKVPHEFIPLFRDALLTSFINSATSFISGFVIFSVLGYMAHTSGQKIEDVATEGPGLVFDVYPGRHLTTTHLNWYCMSIYF